MTLAQAREHLSKPLRFGDTLQIHARNLIDSASAILSSPDLELCHECDGSGDSDLPGFYLCGRCVGLGVIDGLGDPYDGVKLEVRMAARELQREADQLEYIKALKQVR